MTNSTLRGLWLVIIVIVAALAGAAGGLLAWVGGATAPMATLTGAGAFGGAVLLLLAMFRFVTSSDD